MSKKELIEKLKEYKDDLEIDVNVILPVVCTCGPTEPYCYCSSSDQDYSIVGVSERMKYNETSKRQEIISLTITTQR